MRVRLAAIAALLSWLAIFLIPFFEELLFDAPTILKGKRVVVAGASQGIGREIAKYLCAAGANVLLSARSVGKLAEVAARCTDLGGVAHVYAADLSDSIEAERFVDVAVSELGGIDLLLLNHAVYTHRDWVQPRLGATARADIGVFKEVRWSFEVNALSYLTIATHALPSLVRSGGSIGVVSSLAGQFGMPKMLVYSGCKHAVNGMFRAIRSELMLNGINNVSVTIHTIGSVDTESARESTRTMGMDPSSMSPLWHSAEAASRSIVVNTALRRRESFFPFFEVRYLLAMNAWAPTILDRMLAALHQYGK